MRVQPMDLRAMTLQSLPAFQNAANIRYLELAIIACLSTIRLRGRGFPRRPEVVLLGLAFGLNAQDLLFDFPGENNSLFFSITS